MTEARDVLRTQLGLKFGEVPDWVETQLMQADHEQLQQWMREVLFADHLDTMFTR
ncbi:hypothetical protein HLB35_12725 [Halomonas sp. TBZ9]|uniref:DUF4351 domain-containing protein n=1 Tax=Vreelandella azerica TaxID=2732867 RepID=A0A7Y3TYN7_9GAMM|nr:hypothetical protein [Halomonas azerica]NOG32403.1 hypothetical protein [Halomonas azerica]